MAPLHTVSFQAGVTVREHSADPEPTVKHVALSPSEDPLLACMRIQSLNKAHEDQAHHRQAFSRHSPCREVPTPASLADQEVPVLIVFGATVLSDAMMALFLYSNVSATYGHWFVWVLVETHRRICGCVRYLTIHLTHTLCFVLSRWRGMPHHAC